MFNKPKSAFRDELRPGLSAGRDSARMGPTERTLQARRWGVETPSVGRFEQAAVCSAVFQEPCGRKVDSSEQDVAFPQAFGNSCRCYASKVNRFVAARTMDWLVAANSRKGVPYSR